MLSELIINQSLQCPEMFQGKKVLVVGLGATGLSCVRFLDKRGVELAVTDTRENPPGLDVLREQYPHVAVFIGGFEQAAFERSDILVVSPGVAVAEPLLRTALQEGKKVIGDIEIFAICNTVPTVGITGSNGKSTVTKLVDDMARMANKKVVAGGNFGTPALDLLDNYYDAQLFVLELSSFQLETTSLLNTEVSALLNISEDHMDRYADITAYADAKARIFSHAQRVVYNRDDQNVVDIVNGLPAALARTSFSLDENTGADFYAHQEDGTVWLMHRDAGLIRADELHIQGMHNVANVLAAMAIAHNLSLPMPAILQAATRFTGLPHRTQFITAINDVSWFNDSKATNVGATLAAINGMQDRRLILFLGGQGKGQDFSPLAQALQKHVYQVFLYGQDAELIHRQIEGSTRLTMVADLKQGIESAQEITQAGDVVLFSPACASFDMFKNYEHRGEVFARLVGEIVR